MHSNAYVSITESEGPDSTESLRQGKGRIMLENQTAAIKRRLPARGNPVSKAARWLAGFLSPL